jgi:hypothetical protein
MQNAILLILAALIAVGILVMLSVVFTLYPLNESPDHLVLSRLHPTLTRVPGYVRKGIRDLASGLVVLTMMLTADRRLVGIALLVEAIILFGDMSIILGSGGSGSRAFSIHGVTCAVLLVVGLFLIHAI